jgi:zinc/manganese transport system substrate-binding protein
VIRPGKALVLSVALATAAAGCSSATGAPPGSISIVASTNVWGGIARQLAGRLSGGKVVVTSLISNASADPHSYEASTRNQLAIAHADLILENGGGYDDFMTSLRSSAGGSASVIDAVKVSVTNRVHGALNEHVWYDLGTVARVADRITRFLVARDRRNAATYRANDERFLGQLANLDDVEERIRAAHAGDGVAVTEPVPGYLLDACGLVDRTPAEFGKAVEDGTDVSPRVLQQTLALFTGHEVKALVYNAQTTGPQTDQVKASAHANRIPIVPVTETLPSGKTFYSWMRSQLAALAAALT